MLILMSKLYRLIETRKKEILKPVVSHSRFPFFGLSFTKQEKT